LVRAQCSHLHEHSFYIPYYFTAIVDYIEKTCTMKDWNEL